jgi:hypothetical protein
VLLEPALGWKPGHFVTHQVLVLVAQRSKIRCAAHLNRPVQFESKMKANLVEIESVLGRTKWLIEMPSSYIAHRLYFRDREKSGMPKKSLVLFGSRRIFKSSFKMSLILKLK